MLKSWHGATLLSKLLWLMFINVSARDSSFYKSQFFIYRYIWYVDNVLFVYDFHCSIKYFSIFNYNNATTINFGIKSNHVRSSLYR